MKVSRCRSCGAEIISADSRQVYRRMDIGTGKDLVDYEVSPLTSHLSPLTSIKVPYHLIDIAEPGTKYNLFQYQQDFFDAYNNIIGRGKTPILCGGTGLYIEAVLKGYQLSPVPQNPELRQRLAGKKLDELTQMLTELKAQTGSNMHNKTDVDSCQRAIRAIEIEEVKGLLAEGIPAEDLIYYGLEYKFVTEYLVGKTSYDEMFQRLEIAIHQFAKRQMTWFRGMERRGFTIHWIDALQPMPDKVQQILSLLV